MRILIPAFSALTFLSLAAGAEEGRKVQQPPPGAQKHEVKVVPVSSGVSIWSGRLRKAGTATAKGVEKGADKTAKGVEKGTDKAAKGVEKGADKTAKGVNKAADKTAKGVEKGADKTKQGAKKAADKVKQ